MHYRWPSALLMLGMLAGAPGWASAADASPAPARPRVGQVWGFTLPALDGSRFVRSGDFRGPVLVNFWGVDCGPCRAELPRLQQFARSHRRWTVVLVSTDAPAAARQFVQSRGITLDVLRPGAGVGALLRHAGDPSGALPFTVAVRAARICASQLGALAAADLQRIATRCTRPDGTAPAQGPAAPG